MQVVTLILWILFFVSTVVGHIGMKLAVEGKASSSLLQTLSSIVHPWALGALAAWVVSALVWMVLVARHELYVANAISALRYICIAIACAIVLQEDISARDWGAMGLITAGALMIR